MLEALGIGVEVGPKDVAIRGNFCTIDAEGRVTDRRAGRIPTETCEKLVAKLRAGIKIDGVETLIEPVREYRLVVRFRGEGLGDNVCDTDPLSTGLHTLEPKAGDAASEKTAKVAAEFLRQAKAILKDERPANFLMMRGFAKFPKIATMEDVYGLKAGRDRRLPDVPRPGPPGRHDRRRAGQDPGRPDGGGRRPTGTRTTSSSSTTSTPTAPARTATSPKKVEMIEALDAEIPKLTALKPDVLIVTGDHSTPSRMRSHSFHPVPPCSGPPPRVAPTSSRPSASGPASRGDSASSSPRTSCRWPWPTPVGCRSSVRKRSWGWRSA